MQLRYHLRPLPCPSPYNRRQAVTQPRYFSAISHLLQQEEQANVFIDPASGQALKYRHLICGPYGATWVKALVNDLRRLAQGVGTRMPTGTNTVFFVAKYSITHDRKVTYARMDATIRTTKAKVNPVRVNLGGDCLNFLAQWVVLAPRKLRQSPPKLTRTWFTSALVVRMVASIRA